VQVKNEDQVYSVLEIADEVVGTVLIDDRLGDKNDYEFDAIEIIMFDDELAIARSLTSFVQQWTDYDTPAVVILGGTDLARRIEALMVARGFDVDRSVNNSKNNAQNRDPVDVLVGITDQKGVIGTATVDVLDGSGLLLDAGINSFSRKAIETARERDIEVLRSDVRAGFITEIECELITREMISKKVGSQFLDDIEIVAGGKIGSKGSVVVDSIENPSTVIGIADGSGSIVRSPGRSGRERIQRVKSMLKQGVRDR
jgi:hypothetical protein